MALTRFVFNGFISGKIKKTHTVDGRNIAQVQYVFNVISQRTCRVLYIAGGAGFLPSTVPQEIVTHLGKLGIDHITFSFCKPYKQSVLWSPNILATVGGHAGNGVVMQRTYS